MGECSKKSLTMRFILLVLSIVAVHSVLGFPGKAGWSEQPDTPEIVTHNARSGDGDWVEEQQPSAVTTVDDTSSSEWSFTRSGSYTACEICTLRKKLKEMTFKEKASKGLEKESKMACKQKMEEKPAVDEAPKAEDTPEKAP